MPPSVSQKVSGVENGASFFWDASAPQDVPTPSNAPSSVQDLSVTPPSNSLPPRRDKASQILGIAHRKSMEPIPASARNSIMTVRSATYPAPAPPPHTPTSTLASLYVVSGLPKSPHTWTLADPDSTAGLHHSDGAVGRWWRAEVLGNTVSPGVGGRRKKRGGGPEIKGPGALSKHEVAKMLSKTLKLSFTREVEIITSTLQPASTVHTFTFTLPTQSSTYTRSSLAPPSERNSGYSTSAYPYFHSDDPFAGPRPSSSYIGVTPPHPEPAQNTASDASMSTWHGVCLTVWSHADAERSAAIRRALESSNSRARKESAQSVMSAKLRGLRSDRKRKGVPWSTNSGNGTTTDGDVATDGETEGDAISESEFDASSTRGPGGSTLFLPGDAVFWLPYALTLVSRHPVYDLMRDYLTLSWARFSKDVAAHTLQISKILSAPAPRAGDIVRLDASASTGAGANAEESQGTLEVVCRFPGGLDFGRGLVDMNFTMWPLFRCLNLDNILSICEIALAPTGRVLFLSRHPAMLGIAVSTLKYLVELRGWSGIALPIVHARDAKIYVDDPGPWIIGMNTEIRYAFRPAPEVCICDLDINYVTCSSPPPNSISIKQQREKYKQKLLAAFDTYYHPDHGVPNEFKEAFPAGRFRPLCKIQAKRSASSVSAAVVSEVIKAPEWWNGTKVIQAIDSILQEKTKKPSLLRRITFLGAAKRMPQLTQAEKAVQRSIRKRAVAFVDARDDLETKIGRLSRRLNFLVTESDLWREKFITFEQYAEKLSTEAAELRAKINKEQRESKRLSGLITTTAQEKIRLQAQLQETEAAHHDAVNELEIMRVEMEKLEQERALMVAEVEAQIERALASMQVDDSEYGSRPTSPRVQSPSSNSSSRRPSINIAIHRGHRSFATDSTVTEPTTDGEKTSSVDSTQKTVVAETNRSESPEERRFTGSQDLDRLDAGISEQSDKITQKVLQIQQKVAQNIFVLS
ncbi:hypothetical protein SISSUDRAFT_976953 [Sistotremastrum suecicum HHB10207 ss-3]|uniref:cDENN domain-containing protein n=1 Tax=Sistotremastrum suecicum HHB10207 ss-3 TaxID=1314776 RepID=A0A166J500_9AGAM|nr:hypothetical protein SISSUDRAFT_976953 [Sistotremastrum suecicum HHB10207 ss-3]